MTVIDLSDLPLSDGTGLFLDFDGTLSEIVPHPDDARPLDGIATLLEQVQAAGVHVLLISGRSALQLLEWIGDRFEIWGTHGAELVVDGGVEMAPKVVPYLATVTELARVARSELEARGVDVLVEDKRVMVTLHWRMASDHGEAERGARAVATDLARRFGFVLADGRRSIEIRPPVPLSKADVVRDRARDEGLTALAFAGDDRVDLEAFDALDDLEAEGVRTVRIAVDSREAPPELLERANIVVPGPRGLAELLAGWVSS